MSADSLSSLLYFLAFGVFFYWMMKKGGCGMHGHGGHGAHGGYGQGHDEHTGDARQGDVASAKDPVCGMAVDPNSATGSRTVSGRKFYFCSSKCLEKFDGDPEGFARRAPSDKPHQRHQRRGMTATEGGRK